MKLVIVESPFTGDMAKNLIYARAAMRDCLKRGEAPYASHLLYTQPGILDDKLPNEREMGMEAGFAWREVADLTVVYSDLGVSPGMLVGIEDSKARAIPIEYRSLPGWCDRGHL